MSLMKHTKIKCCLYIFYKLSIFYFLKMEINIKEKIIGSTIFIENKVNNKYEKI